jgi:fused signal recognition particle receptor
MSRVQATGPALDDPDTIARFGEDWLHGIDRLSLPDLLQASPIADISDSIAAIRDALLADDPVTMRRRVGWWGRLLGNDIEQQARAGQLASRLRLLLVQARDQLATLAAHIDRLDRCHAALSATLTAMHAGIAEASRQLTVAPIEDPLSAAQSPGARLERRLAHLGKLLAANQLNLLHLDQTRQHLRLLRTRYAHTLQELAPLAAQQAMLRDGRRQQAAVTSANRSLAAVEQALHDSTLAPTDEERA